MANIVIEIKYEIDKDIKDIETLLLGEYSNRPDDEALVIISSITDKVKSLTQKAFEDGMNFRKNQKGI